MDNYDSVEEATKFMESAMFRENPIGTDFEPEELARMIQAGVKEEVIKKRVEVGPRGLPGVF